MAEPTLEQVFGVGATQDANTITIQKSALAITASATNRAEQLLAAILKKAGESLTAENYGINPDQSVNIQPGFDSIVYRTFNSETSSHLQTQLTVNFSKLQVAAGITPDDY